MTTTGLENYRNLVAFAKHLVEDKDWGVRELLGFIDMPWKWGDEYEEWAGKNRLQGPWERARGDESTGKWLEEYGHTWTVIYIRHPGVPHSIYGPEELPIYEFIRARNETTKEILGGDEIEKRMGKDWRDGFVFDRIDEKE